MALGGGTFTTQNKKLPGSYINFVGTKRAVGLSDRGTAAVALELPWGELDGLMEVSKERAQKLAKKLFGYSYDAPEMLPIRELFIGAQKLFVYRLGTGGNAADGTLATARYVGTAGNKITITVTATTDGENQTGWIVRTYFENEVVDEQKAATTATTDTLEDNDFVIWKESVELAELTKTTGVMKGGTDPTSVTTHGSFLRALQSKTLHTVACSSTSETIMKEYVSFVKEMRDAYGNKCQVVVYNMAGDYEGVINAVNKINNETTESGNIVYWVAGIEAGCAVNASCTNKLYDGELDVNTDYTQEELEDALDAGQFVLHLVGDDVRVLDDINSLVTLTQDKTEDFKSNQTVRVLDQLAADITSRYNKFYIGLIPNDTAGREALWNDIVTICNMLQDIRAIENFKSADIEVLPGEKKKAVVVNMAVTPVNAMSQLYCTVYVS